MNSAYYTSRRIGTGIGSIKLSTLCYILGLIWMFRIGSIAYFIHGFNAFYYIVGVIELALALCVYASSELKLTRIHRLLLEYCVLLLIITLAKGESTFELLLELLNILAMALAMDIGLRGNRKRFLKTGYSFAAIMISLNTVSALIFPQAMAYDATGAPTVFFLGADNSMIVRYMHAMLFECLYQYELSDCIRIPYCGLINLFVFSFVRDIAAGKVMALILLALFILAVCYRKFRLRPLTALSFNALFLVIVVIGESSIGWADPLFQALGRSSDFTHRTILWRFALSLISQNPISGIGYFNDDKFNYLILSLTNSGLYNTGNPHNTYLTILLSGGAALFILFAVIMFVASKKTGGLEDCALITILAIFLLTFMLHAQVEGRDTAYLMMMATCIFLICSPSDEHRVPS